MSSFGAKAVAALFALFDRAKLSGGPKALARETIAPDMIALLDELVAKHRAPRAKREPKAEELGETLVNELEQTAAFSGVNVRNEYLLCEDWCRDKKQPFTRNRFKAWLRKEARDVLTKSPGGNQVLKLVAKSVDLRTEPMGWRITLLRIHPSIDKTELARKEWTDLSPALRSDILKAAS